jgi:general secretion pathway protein G
MQLSGNSTILLNSSFKSSAKNGFTLIELVVTLTVLAVLTLGALPLVQNAVQRQKEERLRETLRDVRAAIDEFKRDAIGGCQQGNVTVGNPAIANNNIPVDPRSRVVISDCEIFEAENLDRFPPTLEILVEGVEVKPRDGGAQVAGPSGSIFDQKNATELGNSETSVKKKKYLREMPVDPMTGESDWLIRSCYQDKDSESWDNVNVFDIRSNARGEALNGEKYSDW